MENEENVITMGDIFRAIKKRAWIVAAVSVACCLVFFCAVQFWYNNVNRDYKATCYISFPGVYSEKTQSVYPDGTVFRAEDIISYEALNDIKEQGGDLFASVDIEKMIQEDRISVSVEYSAAAATAQTAAQSQSASAASPTQADVKITINASSSCFQNADQAREFIQMIAEYPVLYAQALVETSAYDMYLQNYRGEDASYGLKVNSLVSQQKYLLDMYDALIQTKGTYYIVSFTSENGTSYSGTLDSFRSRCAAAFGEDEQQSLLEEMEVNGYMYDADSFQEEAEKRMKVLQTKIADLDFQISLYNTMISKLESEGGSESLISQLNKVCVQLVQERSLYATEQEKIQQNLENPPSEEEIAAFESKLNSYFAILEAQTQIYKNVRTQYFEQESYFRMQNNKLAVTGGISPVIAVIGGLIAGFILSSAVVCVVEFSKMKKHARQAENSARQEEDGPQA